MINKIEMNIPNYIVSIDDNKCIINDKEIDISKDDINNIIRTIRAWNKEYRSNSIIDNPSSIVLYKDEEIIDKFIFEGLYPEDFYNLLDIVGEIYAR